MPNKLALHALRTGRRDPGFMQRITRPGHSLTTNLRVNPPIGIGGAGPLRGSLERGPNGHRLASAHESHIFSNRSFSRVNSAVHQTAALVRAKGIRPMSLSELFIKRPITTTLIMLGIGVFGAEGLA